MKLVESLFQDLRYGVRMIGKSRTFTLLAVLALALGICANTTIFSFINGMLLRPIAGVEDSGRLASVYTSDFSSGLYGGSSYPDYIDFRNDADTFTGLAAYQDTVLSFAGAEDAERISGQYVTGNFFEVLGVAAQLGRTLQAADDQPGAQAAAISDRLWRNRFQADANVVGRSLKLGSNTYTIVGVIATTFHGIRLGPAPDFWLGMTVESGLAAGGRGDRGIEIVGRLKPGITISQAQAQVTTIAARLAQTYPDTNIGTLARPNEPRPVTVTAASRIDPQGQMAVWTFSLLLLAVVGFVLLIACANVANLLLARASVRQREIATRLALGASRVRLIRQLLTESFLLALLGGGVGLTLTIWSSGLLTNFFPSAEASGVDLCLDWRVLLFTLVVVLLTACLFGLTPAIRVTRPDLIAALKTDARSGGRRARLNLREGLVIGQLALSMVVLVGAALFVRSLQHALDFDPGFNAQNLLLASVETEGLRMDKDQGRQFYQQLLDRTRQLPGVRAASLTSVVPISGGGERRGVTLEGYQPKPKEDRELNTNVVGLEFFKTMGIPIVQGRDFNDQDRKGGPPVVIVNEELARRYFSGQNPIGKWLAFGSGEGLEHRAIVGVARTAKYRDLREEPLPFIYIPFAQEYRSGMSLLVSTTNDPLSLAPAVRREVHELNKEVPVQGVGTMSAHITEYLSAERMIAMLLAIFGGAALLLASIGIYGVVGYSVAQRTHEIGVRLALGAERSDILKLIVRQGMRLVLIGSALGLALAFALTRVVKNLLFGIGASDPLTFGGIALLLITVALLACYFPARRATKVDPLVALRYE
jgi:macrolide transport system ATP-binding/permease protein